MRRIALGTAFGLVLSVSVGFAAEDDNKAVLKNQKEIDITFDVDDGEPRCGGTVEGARSVAINKLVPAGFLISPDAQLTLSVGTAVLDFPQHDMCVTSIVFQILFYATYKDVANGAERFGPIEVFYRSRIFSSAPDVHSVRLRDSLQEYLDLFLARWREVNAGTPLVTRKP